MSPPVSRYIKACYQTVPTNVYVGLLILFCVGTVFLVAFWGTKKGLKWSSRLLLLEYLFLLISLTLVFRSAMAERMHYFMPFRSYRAIMAGSSLTQTQNLMNVLVFVPVGILLGRSFNKVNWWKMALFAAGFSLLIETLQFVTKRGFAEFDDVFHNVLGSLIGYGVYVGIAWVVKMARRKRSVSSQSV